ncbi:hypothetical protein BH18ACT15_BH18ACT15_10640 [soil metagenome]
MIKADLQTLFDYSYWATGQLLTAAEELTPEEFLAPADVTYRNIRGTLVHALDVERSWRRRLRGEPRKTWDVELPEGDFPTVTPLAAAWHDDEADMRNWLEGLDDAAVEDIVDLGPKDRFPLSTFLLHILTHTAQQRRDIAILLERAGYSPPEIEFLYYADSRAET